MLCLIKIKMQHRIRRTKGRFSITAGEGTFTMEFTRYDVVPPNVAQPVIARAQAEKKEES